MKNVLISTAHYHPPTTCSIFQENTVIQRKQHFLISSFWKKEQIRKLNQVFLSADIFLYMIKQSLSYSITQTLKLEELILLPRM